MYNLILTSINRPSKFYNQIVLSSDGNVLNCSRNPITGVLSSKITTSAVIVRFLQTLTATSVAVSKISIIA